MTLTHFSALLDEVEQLGEKIIITRKRVPVAMLVPYQGSHPPVAETIDALLKFRQKLHLKGLSIKEMKEEGRRF